MKGLFVQVMRRDHVFAAHGLAFNNHGDVFAAQNSEVNTALSFLAMGAAVVTQRHSLQKRHERTSDDVWLRLFGGS